MIAIAVTALAAGLLAGLTGIGGVILVPALTEFARTPVDMAIGTTMFSLIFAGSLAAFAVLRRVKLNWRPVTALCLAAALGAIVGSVTLDWLPVPLLRLIIATVAVASGLYALRDPVKLAHVSYTPTILHLLVVGGMVGWGSAISGTGGPVMLIPILMTLGTGSAVAVGYGLASHLPIIITSSAIHITEGRVDFSLAAAIAVPMVVGTVGGMWLFRRLSSRGLTVCVAIALVAVGLWYAVITLKPSHG